MPTIRLASTRVNGCPIVAVVLLALFALWPHCSDARTFRSDRTQGTSTRFPGQQPHAATRVCSTTGALPGNEEDRRLVKDGRRSLTGRSQRNGDTYVVEAISHLSTGCAGRVVQLYLFSDGVLLGPATRALPLDHAHFRSFTLLDAQHLRYIVSESAADASRCARTTTTRPAAVTALVKKPQGWSLRRSPDADISFQARTPLRYPTDTHGHRHEGTVVIHVDVDKEGFPSHVTVARTSSYPELDQAAIESVRRGCFDSAQPGIDVPVSFSVHTL